MARPGRSAALLALAVFAALVPLALNAWVADDAFITFRVVGHLLEGHGLRWNIDERVQVYTHPLWMLLHIPAYAVSGNIFLSTIALSLLCAAGALALLLAAAPATPWHKALWVLLPFALSKTLRDHMASGLEAPLLALLVAWFWWLLLRWPHRPGLLVLAASLAMLTRLDSALLLAPPLAYALWPLPRKIQLRALLNLWPLALWFAFSLLYYGFLFPNTKYAKLHTGIAFRDYLAQGGYYVRDFASYDLFSAMLVSAALLWAALGVFRKEGQTPLVTLNATAILLYLGYVMAVGGDFMAGRFLALPVFLSLLLLAQLGQGLQKKTLALPALAMLALFALHCLLYAPRAPEDIIARHGIADERYFYRDTNALLTPEGDFRTEVTGKWRFEGESAWMGAVDNVIEYGFTGVYGFYADDFVIIIDWNALSDPLLARLPIPDPKLWRIGHFTRDMPPGYLLARRTGDTSQMEPGMREYYEALRLVTGGPLFSAARLKAILDFQLGRYALPAPERPAP